MNLLKVDPRTPTLRTLQTAMGSHCKATLKCQREEKKRGKKQTGNNGRSAFTEKKMKKGCRIKPIITEPSRDGMNERCDVAKSQ